MARKHPDAPLTLSEQWALDKAKPLTMDIIAHRIAEGQTLKQICVSAGWPKSYVWKWINDDPALLNAYNAALQKTGARLLADLTTLNIPYQGTGLVARRGLIANSPDVVERTAAAHGLRAGRYVLFVGTVEPRKNLRTLVEAYRRLRCDADVDLALVGPAGWNEDLDALLRPVREIGRAHV